MMALAVVLLTVIICGGDSGGNGHGGHVPRSGGHDDARVGTSGLWGGQGLVMFLGLVVVMLMILMLATVGWRTVMIWCCCW